MQVPNGRTRANDGGQVETSWRQRHWLYVAAAVVLLTLAGCDEGDPDKTATDYLASAEKELGEDDYDAAIIQLKNALKSQPENAEARLKLGQVYLQTNRLASAHKEFRRAREAGAEPAKVLPLLAETLNRQNKPEETLQLIDDASAEVAESERLRLHQVDALLARNDAAAAERVLNSLASDSPATLRRRATLEAVRGNGDKALKLAQRAAASKDSGVDAHLLHGRLLMRVESDVESAHSAFQKAVQVDPRSPDAFVALARSQVQLDRLEAAESTLDRLQKLGVSTPVARHLRSVIALRRGEYETAKDMAEALLGEFPDYVPAATIAGLAHSELGNHEIAIERLNNALSQEGTTPPAVLEALARSNLALGRADKALDYLERDDLAKKDSRASKLAAVAALAGGDYVKGMSLLERVLSDEPDNVTAATNLASLKFASGEREAALDILDKLSKTESLKDAEAKARVGLTYLRAEEFAKAREIARKLKAQEPDTASGYLLDGLALRGLGELDPAAGELEKALARDPANVAASLNLAELRRNQDQLDDAARVLENSLEAVPDSLQVKLSLSRVKMEQGDFKRGENLIREVIQARPDSVRPRLILGRYLLAQGKNAAALEQAQEAANASDRVMPDVLQLLASAQRAVGDTEAALDTLRDLTSKQPDSPDAHFMLAETYAALGDSANAINALRRVLDLRQDADRARLVLARLLVRAEQLDAADRHIRDLEQSLPDTAAVAAVRGAYHLANEQTKDAISAYQRAFKLDPRPGRAMLIARLQQGQGQVDEARRTLESALDISEKPAQTARIHAELASLARRSGDRAAALRHYQDAIETQPGSAAYHNDYAWTLWQANDLSKAKKHAERALELAPDTPSIQDTLGVVLLELGEAERAQSLLRRAVDASPERIDFRYHLAQANAQTGKTDNAVALLEEILAQGNTAYDEQARQLLNQLRD